MTGGDRRPSLAGRAVAAVALMFGFYVLALVVVGVLFWLPYAEWRYAERLHIQLAIACVLGGFAIVAAVFPRRDKFEPPGPLLTRAAHPRLFALIAEVAAATAQPVPRDVYLVPDANAFVTQRGGWMGVGSRRVMGVGLPLLQVLSVTELRAVLAHEFGHYHHGDTALGPWIYTTRAAIVRTLVSLRESAVQFAFVWYWKAFLRVTHGISRAQEFAADALAAQVVGAAPLASGLRKVAGVSAAQAAYFQQELGPVLRAGRRPPLAAGFEQFLRAPRIRASVEAFVESEMKSSRDDPYDTHPPLPRRLEVLSGFPALTGIADDRPAIALLSDPDELEAPLVEAITGWRVAATRPPIEWSDVGRDVHLPVWRKAAREFAPKLAALTPATLPTDLAGLAAVGRRAGGSPVNAEDAAEVGAQMLGIALAIVLARTGCTLRCELGEPVTFEKGGATIDPFAAPRELVQGGIDRAAWIARCRATGIADIDLGTTVNA